MKKIFILWLIVLLPLASAIGAEYGTNPLAIEGASLIEKDPAKAERLLKQAYAEEVKKSGKESTRSMQVLYLLAGAYAKQGKKAEADKIWKEVTEYADKITETRHLTYEMNWRDCNYANHPGERCIELYFTDSQFSDLVTIYSKDLDIYLKTLNGAPFKVIFEVSYDTEDKTMSGFNEIQIGELKQWHSSGGHNTMQGGYK